MGRNGSRYQHAVLLGHPIQRLLVPLADRDDDLAPFSQLFDEWLGHRLRAAGHDDFVEGSCLGPPEKTIPDTSRNVVVIEPLERFGGPFSQLLHDFDRVDTIDQWTEHRGLITASGADFQDHIARLGIQRLGHESNDEGAADRLGIANRQCHVEIGAIANRLRNEFMTRCIANRLQHTLVFDAGRGDVLFHHLTSRLGKGILAKPGIDCPQPYRHRDYQTELQTLTSDWAAVTGRQHFMTFASSSVDCSPGKIPSLSLSGPQQDRHAKDVAEQDRVLSHRDLFQGNVIHPGNVDHQLLVVLHTDNVSHASAAGVVQGDRQPQDCRQFCHNHAFFLRQGSIALVRRLWRGAAMIAGHQADLQELSLGQPEQVAVPDQVQRVFVIASNVDHQANFVQQCGNKQDHLVPAIQTMLCLQLVE